MSEGTTKAIFIVDDDPAICDALTEVLKLQGYGVTCFRDGRSFLNEAQAETPSCILLDIHMPGHSGLDILKKLNAQQYRTPILMISGQGDIPMAVEAIRNGAFDFIEKPLDAGDVLARVQHALDASTRRIDISRDVVKHLAGLKQLTQREREVLRYIAVGESNKEAARLLGISPRTVEVHRARAMEKLGARNAADLIRILMSSRRR